MIIRPYIGASGWYASEALAGEGSDEHGVCGAPCRPWPQGGRLPPWAAESGSVRSFCHPSQTVCGAHPTGSRRDPWG